MGESSDCPASLQYLPKNISSAPVANDTIPPPPFVGEGYVLVEAKHAAREVGCLNGAGAFISSVSNTSCAVFAGKASGARKLCFIVYLANNGGTGNAVILASTKGLCSVHNSEIKCGSDITSPSLFHVCSYFYVLPLCPFFILLYPDKLVHLGRYWKPCVQQQN